MINKQINKSSSLLIIFLAIFLILSIATSTEAVSGTTNTKYVNLIGNDTNDGDSQGTAFQSIGRAVNNSTSTDNPNDNVIIIGRGNYSGVDNRFITIEKNISIYGAKYKGMGNIDTLISGHGGTDRIFQIGSGVTVQIYGIQFQNINMTGIGGAIYSNGGTLKLYNVSFNNCTSYYGGGAVYGTSISYNCSFINVNFTNCTSTMDNGGAVYGQGLNWFFYKCDFHQLYK